MTKPAGLITDPSEAKAELELNEPATKSEVMKYVKNHHLQVVHPMFAQMTQSLQGNFNNIQGSFNSIAKQRDQIAFLLNNLIDFLEQDGFRVGKDGHVRLNQQEFQAFVKKRADRINGANAASPANQPS